MFDLRKLPIIRVLFPFTLGSGAGYLGLGNLNDRSFLWICAGIWCVLILLYLGGIQNRDSKEHLWRGLGFLLFLVIGFGTGGFKSPVDP
jgi:hypothetical protein